MLKDIKPNSNKGAPLLSVSSNSSSGSGSGRDGGGKLIQVGVTVRCKYSGGGWSSREWQPAVVVEICSDDYYR